MIPWARRGTAICISTLVLLMVIPLGLLCMVSLPSERQLPRLALHLPARGLSPTPSPTTEPTSTSTATETQTPAPSRTPTALATSTRTRTATPTATATAPVERLLSVPVILQELPLSCEFAGMRMVASALLGKAEEEEELIACMPRNPDPDLGFRGDPAGYNHFEDGSINWENYGAYAPAVAAALNSCILEPAGGQFQAYAHRKVTYQEVADSVLNGFPVIVWVTKRGEPDTTTVGPPDSPVSLVFGEHVWVVAGYHADGAFEIIDPYPQKDERQTMRVQSFPNWNRFEHMAVFIGPRPPDPELSR